MGEVTLRRKRLRKGLEPDECYYVLRTAPPQSRGELNLEKFLPPDLAIEIDDSNSSIPRRPIYAGLKVAEVLWHSKQGLISLQRNDAGDYVPSQRSLCLPELSLDVLNRFLKLGIKDQHAAVMGFRDWLREHKPKA